MYEVELPNYIYDVEDKNVALFLKELAETNFKVSCESNIFSYADLKTKKPGYLFHVIERIYEIAIMENYRNHGFKFYSNDLIKPSTCKYHWNTGPVDYRYRGSTFQILESPYSQGYKIVHIYEK